MAQPSVVEDRPRYPYGLCLHIDECTYEKLGLKDPPKVGEKMMVLAMVEVNEVRQAKYEDDVPKHCLSLQITEMDLKKKEKEKDTAGKLYGSEE